MSKGYNSMLLKKPEDKKIKISVALAPDLIIDINTISGEFSRSSTIEGLLRDQIALLKGTKPVEGKQGRNVLLTIALDEQVLADVVDHAAEDVSISYTIETMLTRYMTAVDEAADAEEEVIEDLHPIYG